MLSQPRWITVTRVSMPTASNVISTSVSSRGPNVDLRQPKISRSPGLQIRMRPISKTVPSGSVSMKRPPSRGSKALIEEPRIAGFGATPPPRCLAAKDRGPPSLVVYGHDDERRVLSAVTAIGGRRENAIVAAPLFAEP